MMQENKIIIYGEKNKTVYAYDCTEAFFTNAIDKNTGKFNDYSFHIVVRMPIPEGKLLSFESDERVYIMIDDFKFANGSPSYLYAKGEVQRIELVITEFGGKRLELELNSIYYLENDQFIFSRKYIDKKWQDWVKYSKENKQRNNKCYVAKEIIPNAK